MLSFLWGMLTAVLIFVSVFALHLALDVATPRDDQ
jgi:hypothetical protein